MKKFFFQIMLVLVVAEVAMIAFAWHQSYARAYTYEAITSNNICGCSRGMFQFDSAQVLIDEAWVAQDDVEEPLLQAVWGSYPTDCWHSRAVSSAWDSAFMPITKAIGINALIAAATFVVWTYRDKPEGALNK